MHGALLSFDFALTAPVFVPYCMLHLLHRHIMFFARL